MVLKAMLFLLFGKTGLGGQAFLGRRKGLELQSVLRVYGGTWLCLVAQHSCCGPCPWSLAGSTVRRSWKEMCPACQVGMWEVLGLGTVGTSINLPSWLLERCQKAAAFCRC